MTFEDALLDKAQKDIENTEKLCSEQNNAKKFSLKKAFGLSKHDKHDKLEKQVNACVLIPFFKIAFLFKFNVLEWRK